MRLKLTIVLSVIMSAKEAEKRILQTLTGRSTETAQRSRCPADCSKWCVRQLAVCKTYVLDRFHRV